MSDANLIFTVGHSNRPLAEFLDMLEAHGVTTLADIRTVPRSRHNPQFAADALAPALEERGIAYLHLPELGGLRKPHRDSTNRAWRNQSFRGFADYMQTLEFRTALTDLQRLAAGPGLAVMCAEAVPWRCHRSLVADALVGQAVAVEHILSARDRRPHRLTPFARLGEDGTITYPEPDDQ